MLFDDRQLEADLMWGKIASHLLEVQMFLNRLSRDYSTDEECQQALAAMLVERHLATLPQPPCELAHETARLAWQLASDLSNDEDTADGAVRVFPQGGPARALHLEGNRPALLALAEVLGG